MFRRLFLTTFVLCVVATVSACAGYAPSADMVGQRREALIQQLGQPERETIADGKKKLQFPRGPGGSHTYFVYLNNEDRVADWEQVLTEARFNQIVPGMTKDQVVDLIGISRITHGLARERGYVWHYRYWNTGCSSFVVEFALDDVVRSAGYRIRGGRFCKYVGQ